MVGHHITTRITERLWLVHDRINTALQRAWRIAHLPLPADDRAHLLSTTCLSAMLYGTQWVWPSATKLRALRTAILKAIWGTNRELRAAEIVLEVLHPQRLDPTWAIVEQQLTNARRLFLRDTDKYLAAVRVYHLYQHTSSRLPQGPIRALFQAAQALGGTLLHSPENGGFTVCVNGVNFAVHTDVPTPIWKRDLGQLFHSAAIALRARVRLFAA